MNCEQFENRLQRLLDLRRSPEQDPALQTHSHECPDCRETLALQSRLFQCLRRDRLRLGTDEHSARKPVADGENSVSHRAKPVGRVTGGRVLFARPSLDVCAAVACIAILVIATIAFRSPTNVPTPTQPTDLAMASSTVGSTDVSNVAVTDTPVDESKGAGAVGVPSDDNVARASQVPEPILVPIWESVESHLTPSADSRRSIENFAVGFRPVTESLSTAVQVLRRALLSEANEPPVKPQARVLSLPIPVV